MGDIKDIEGIYHKYIENKFHRISALIISSVLIILLSVSIHKIIKDDFQHEWICLFLFEIVLLFYWLYFKFYIPKNKKDKLGIVLAIYVDESYDKLKLKNNFVRSLRKKIKNEPFFKHVNLIVIKNHQCEEIDSISDIKNINKKIKAHFYLYGEAKYINDVKQKVFISLNGYVTHRPVHLNIHKEIENDFDCILPKEITFEEKLDFRDFKFTTEISNLTIKYILGVSLYVSGFMRIAYDFHSDLQDHINNFIKPLPKNLKSISNKIPYIISNECFLVAQEYYKRKEPLESENWLKKSLSYNEKNHNAWNLKSILSFILYGDLEQSLSDNKQAQKTATNSDFSWLYNKAFLSLWSGKYEQALKVCNQISKMNYPKEEKTVEEVEEFTKQLIKKKEKPEIYFWLGYINYKKKRDYVLAKKYFTNFSALADDIMVSLTNRSNAYLVEINEKLKEVEKKDD